MENLSKNKKISLALGFVVLISLFMPWISYFIFSESLIGISGKLSDLASFGDPKFKHQLVIYIGYAFLILAAASLFFNYKGDIQKAKWAYYSMIGYFGLVIILNIGDIGKLPVPESIPMLEAFMPSIFDILGVGFYVFIASFLVSFKFLKEENDPEVID